MDDIDEKRVFGDRTGRQAVYVATTDGLVRVTASGDRIGGFELADPRAARDVAACSPPGDDPELAVATDDDVLVGETLDPTGFGPAVAVAAGGELLAAGPDGRVARLSSGDWTETGQVADVRALDGDFVAAADGVHRTDGSYLGLADARDVAAAGPFAATGTGLYRLGNGWQLALEGSADAVAADTGRAHAATADALYVRDAPGAWLACDTPVDEPVVDVAYGEAVYAVTAGGQFLASGDGRPDWRTAALGLSGVTALAVP